MRESDVTRAGRRAMPTSRRVRLGAVAVSGAACLFVAACSGTANTPGKNQHGQAGAPAAAASAQIAITPANGSTDSRTNAGISVTVTQGKISNVTVTAHHHPVAGALAAGGTSWQTVWPLKTSTRYTVTVTAVNSAGKTTTTASSFRTASPASTFSATTALGDQTYGVGMPIMISFSSPVASKDMAAVERAIEITTSKPIVGGWMWDGNQALDFRPQHYWPQHTRVSFTAHFNGIEAAPGVYGAADLSQSFTIGNSLIGVTSTRTHKTRIYWKNKLYAVWPDSSGMPGDDTANGTYLTIEKGNPVLMSGPGYKNVPVYWSVRFTWSGNYYHAAPWSLGEQGFANVSHGCVNLSPANAQTYYDWAVPGDPITITGSPSTGTWGDGYTEWFLTWKQLLQRSATHMAVQAGPTGSTFLDPSTLPAPGPASVLTGPPPRNFKAG